MHQAVKESIMTSISMSLVLVTVQLLAMLIR